jgi:uncharacterized cofD-like protein
MAAKDVVVIGGGTGTHGVLRGLKRYNVRLTALLSTFDTSRWGGSLGEDDQTRPADELRASLLALGADPHATQIMERLFAYRVAEMEGSGSRSFGNLFLRALTEIMGTTDLALQAATQVLNVHGRVLPLTLHDIPLLAELADGREQIVRHPGELAALAAAEGFRGVRPSRPVPVLDAAIQAIYDADIIVLGPADLHFNVLAPLQVEAIRAALVSSAAVKIFVCNIMTQAHTTSGWTGSRFIRHVMSHLGSAASIDYAIVNSTPPPADCVERAGRGVQPVLLDLEECLSLGLDIIVRPVAAPDTLLHDSEKLARTILFLGGERVHRRAERALAPVAHPLNGVAPVLALSPNGVQP